MTAIDLSSGLFSDVLQGRQERAFLFSSQARLNKKSADLSHNSVFNVRDHSDTHTLRVSILRLVDLMTINLEIV